jgi:hypothetical protein
MIETTTDGCCETTIMAIAVVVGRLTRPLGLKPGTRFAGLAVLIDKGDGVRRGMAERHQDEHQHQMQPQKHGNCIMTPRHRHHPGTLT